MRKPIKVLFALGLPLALAAFGGPWMLNLAAGKKKDVVYDTVEVQKGAIRKVVATSGPVRALVTVAIGSQISGQIETLKVDFNSEVKKGDVLATIDPRTFEARVAQAKADIEAAKASLSNQQAALNKAEAVKTVSERVLERQGKLREKGFATTATLDNANRDVEVALADINVSMAQIHSAKATIAQREAALKQSEIDLERTKIVSPINGTVIGRTIDLGQTVAANFQAPELFKIAQDLKLIRIEAQVNEADVGAVTESNEATFTVDAYPDRTFQGKVTQVRLNATELQNVVTYTVIVEAKNEDRRLFPGMTANVQIEVAKKDGVLRVPNDALRFKPRNDSDGDGKAGRAERMLAKLENDLQLSSVQLTAVRDELKKIFVQKSGPPGGVDSTLADPSAMRQRVQTVVEQTLSPTLTDEQRPLLEKWKRGRENTKSGSVHVRDAAGLAERRAVRLGIADDQFTEITGGQLSEGERVVIRVRETQK